MLGKLKVAGLIPAGDTNHLWGCIRKGKTNPCQMKHAALPAVVTLYGKREVKVRMQMTSRH